MFNPFKRKDTEKRNAASSSISIGGGQPVYSDLSIAKAVSEGYKINPWVYRAVTLTSDAGSNVPWFVVDADGEPIDNHPLTTLLAKPNPQVSRQTIMQLLISWRQLAGNAYLWKNKVNGGTRELWPVSPDRITPVSTTDFAAWVSGYKATGDSHKRYDAEEIVHFLIPDPSNPIVGIGPLQAAGKTVDTLNEQTDWNKTAMQNRGVLDGMVTFKQQITTQGLLDTLKESINESMSGRKNVGKIGVIGNDASYVSFASTPKELDFIETRKSYINEVLITFGVPPVLAGVTDAATFNNYETSQLVFLLQTIIPMLDDFADTFTMSFRDELGEDERITYDMFALPGIQSALATISETVKNLSEVGVPFNQINRVFKLGFAEFEGWDKSKTAPAPVTPKAEPRRLSSKLVPFEQRNLSDEFDQREDYAASVSKLIEKGLTEQVTAAGDYIVENPTSISDLFSLRQQLTAVVEDNSDKLIKAMSTIYKAQALESSGNIVIEQRAATMAAAIDEAIDADNLILNELSLVDGVSIDKMIAALEGGIDDGLTIDGLKTALLESGIDDVARSLAISRTIVGTAASIGQQVAGQRSGATHKIWRTSIFDVRDEHTSREGETVDINGSFTKQGFTVSPRYPLDQRADAGDRIMCRCSLTFEIRD